MKRSPSLQLSPLKGGIQKSTLTLLPYHDEYMRPSPVSPELEELSQQHKKMADERDP